MPQHRTLAKHAGEFAGDESDLVTHASGGFVIVQYADDGVSWKAEGQQATAGVEREGFCTFDANERCQTAQLAGDVRSLPLEFSGIRLG